MIKMRKTPFLVILGILVTLVAMALHPLLPEKAQAANLSSPWIVDQYTKSRLFVGGYDKETKILHLGWQVSLTDGWKTYWRSPGDAGLPPRWTWKDQKNIRSISVSWPAPERLHIFDMDTFTYHDEVILPIEVVVGDDTQPVSIGLDLEYMICEEICIAQEASYRLDISSPSTIKISLFQKAQLDKYISLVPAKKSGGNIIMRPDPDEQGSLLIELPGEFTDVADLIIEGPERVLFGKASSLGGGANKLFNVIHNSKTTLVGQMLTLTILQEDGGASEMQVTVRP